jgi:hypothetical protein
VALAELHHLIAQARARGSFNRFDRGVGAAVELIYAPFRWRKTEHGLDRTSRERSNARSLLELERLLGDLKRRGELAQIQD